MSRRRPEDRRPQRGRDAEPVEEDTGLGSLFDAAAQDMADDDAAADAARAGEAGSPAAARGPSRRGSLAARGSRGGAVGAGGRPATTRRVWICAGLAGLLGALSLLFAWNLEANLRWVWAAVVGLFLGGAAWVLAALAGSRKRWGMLAVAVCVAGVAVPLVVTTSFTREVERQAQNQDAIIDQGEDYDEAAAASQLPAQIEGAVALGSEQFVDGARVSVDSVDRNANAALAALDPTAPAPEGRYVTARLTVRNNSGDALDPATLIGADLVFKDGTLVDSTQCVANQEHPLLDADLLEDGKSAQIDVCFDVPKTAATDAAVDAAAVRITNQVDPGKDPRFWKTH